MTSPRKPTAGFWITVALVAVLVGYPLSFGPACWSCSRMPQWQLPRAYWPVGWICSTCPDTAWPGISWYAKVGMPKGGAVIVPFTWSEESDLAKNYALLIVRE
jgi:hypothetical protein